jgi:hypothetical protein
MDAELKRRMELWKQGTWEIPEDLDTSNFDFTWRPFHFDRPYIHQFGTQHQKTGGPRFIVPDNEGVKYQDYQIAIKLPNKNNRCWRPLVPNAEIDFSWHPDDNDPPFIHVFGNQWYDGVDMPTYQYRVAGATEKKYEHNLKAKLLPNPSNRGFRPLKIISDFDYSWVPHPKDPPFIYVFGNQWYDATEMPTLEYRVKDAVTRKFVTHPKATLKIEKVKLEDCLHHMVIDTKFNTKYIHFGSATVDYSEVIPEDDLYIHIIDNVEAIVPKEAKSFIYSTLLDYPHIKYHTCGIKAVPLDIIFLSNGEEGAEENYQHLLRLTKNLPNNVIKIEGVKGRVASQHEAAKQSSTAWYFLINAKLRVDDNFDFSWQPDYLDTSKHYIFRAKNIVNGLEYGHMAIVANNKKITLETLGTGLDFTLDGKFEIVDINSGVGVFNTSEWDTWRTAFREAIKLRHSNDPDSIKRLQTWLTVAEGEFAQISMQGAADAVKYYESVEGDFQKLKLSYDWDWLKERFQHK